MSMHRNKGDGLVKFVVFMIFVIPFVFFMFHARARARLYRAADMALAQQADVEYQGIQAKFTAGEYMNTATASCWAGTVERRDYNKSRIIGGFLGEKSKEMAKGVVDGLKTPTKHKEQ